MKPYLTSKTKGVIPIENTELTGKVLVLNQNRLSSEYKYSKFQLWKAISGFGTNPNCRGTAVFCEALSDGEKTRWERYDFIGIASDELVSELIS